MNVIEKKMIEQLKILKNDYGVFEVKAEFEAEGSRMEEMMRLKDVTSSVGIPIILKIGGVEAITDIYNALCIGVKGIVAPMAETPFAVSKFLNVIDKFIAPDNRADIEFAINIETITAYENMDKILHLKNIKLLQGMTIGRVDFVGSLGGDRSIINSDKMYGYCEEICAQLKENGFRVGLGGAIAADSIDFMKRLTDQKLIDKFETRKVVFRADSIGTADAGIQKAVEFELLWLKSKQRYYSRIKEEDSHRIEMLEKRVKQQ